ncbi:uncharacterized protein LOC122528555 [Frieseomelitta varia]|uniref:uncharacterized protein LOC122528555 n=1 Tax=Frieseomelitta varia TaxID=561572 RepID=UPI001CB6B02B|nr:uncharacterized protein LOC122528555 [Frieseomelitta varia]
MRVRLFYNGMSAVGCRVSSKKQCMIKGEMQLTGMRLPGYQQGMRLLRAKVSECKGRRTLVESKKSHREANGWRCGAAKIRVEGEILGSASPVAARSYQVRRSSLLK